MDYQSKKAFFPREGGLFFLLKGVVGAAGGDTRRKWDIDLTLTLLARSRADPESKGRNRSRSGTSNPSVDPFFGTVSKVV